MMVIFGDIGTVTNRIFPADRCSWEQVAVATGGYSIDNAAFYPGASLAIGGRTSAASHPINNARLGFIGKSGRFVEIAS